MQGTKQQRANAARRHLRATAACHTTVLTTTTASYAYLPRIPLLAAATAVVLIAAASAPGCLGSLPRAADAVFVSDPKAATGSGYSAFSLGSGLGSWSAVADFRIPRSDHGVVSYQNSAYILGGMRFDNRTQGYVILTSVVQYDLDTGLSYDMRPLPEPRYRATYALLNGKIYVAGGCDGWDVPSATVYVYDIPTDTWARYGRLTTARSDACSAVVNGKVYVFGGYDMNGLSLASVEVCDTAASSSSSGSQGAVCRQLPAGSNLKEARGDCRAVALGSGLIYVLGGSQYFNNTQQDCTINWVYCYRFLRSVEVFNASSGLTSRRAPMIAGRGDFGAAVLPGGRILVAGGERSNGERSSLAMYDVEEYVVQHDTWVRKASMPQARFRFELAATASGRVFAFGGVPTCNLTPDTTCDLMVTSTAWAYTDVPYPPLYVAFKAAGASAAVASP